MPDFLVIMLIGFGLLAFALLMQRWAVRAERRVKERELRARVYYPTRGCKGGAPPFQRRRTAREHHDGWLADLDVDEWIDRT